MSPRPVLLAAVLTLALPGAASARLVAYSSKSCDQGGAPGALSGPTLPGLPADTSCASSIWIANTDGSAPRRLTNAAVGDAEPQWSPDGATIVYTHQELSPRGDFFAVKSRIWAMNADGSNQHALTSGGNYGSDAEPHFSADDSRIVFFSSRVYDYEAHGGAGAFGPTTLVSIAPDGSDVQQLTPRGTVASSPAWSADGRRISFGLRAGDPSTGTSAGSSGVFVSADSTGADMKIIGTSGPLGLPILSPNEQFAAYGTDNWDTFVVDLRTGTGELASPPFLLLHDWDPDAPATLRLFGFHYDAHGRQFQTYWRVDFMGARPHHVASPPWSYDPAPVAQPRPGDVTAPSPELPPVAVAASQLGPPTSFQGGPLPEDPWYAASKGRQAPPAAVGASARTRLDYLALAPAGLAAVRVSLGLRRSGGGCRFLDVGHGFSGRDACAALHFVSTGGPSRWQQFIAALPHGTYFVRFEAVDRRHRRSKVRGRPAVVHL